MVHVGTALAFVPPGGQLGLGSDVDRGELGLLGQTYGPSTIVRHGAPRPGLAVDPVNPDLRVLGFEGFAANTASPNAAVWHTFDHRPEIGLDARPSALTVEFDYFFDGDQGSTRILELPMEAGSANNLVVSSRNDSTSRIQYSAGGGLRSVIVPGAIEAGGWRRIRVAYSPATTPGVDGSADGQVRLWYQHDPQAGSWQELAHLTDADAGKVGTMRLVHWPMNLASESSAYFRNFAWTPQVVTPQEDARLFTDYGANLSAQVPDGQGGIAQRFVYHHDRNLYGAGTGVTATIEYTTPDDPTFAHAISTSPIVVDENGQWTGDAMATGLDANATYLHRTVIEVEGGQTVISEAAPFKTMTVPGGERGTIRFAFGACSSSGPGFAPHHPYDFMANENLNYLLHLGDVNYQDSLLAATRGPDWADDVTAEDYGFYYRQNLMSSQWRKLHAQVPLFAQWDDHEVENDFEGMVWEHGTAKQQHLLEVGEAAANLFIDRYQPPHMDFGGHTYKPDAPDGYSIENVHYYNVETAATLTIVLDNRRFRDSREGSRQMLGQAQLDWAMELLSSAEQPVVFLASGIPWSSLEWKPGDRWLEHGEWATERQALFDAALANPNIERVILLSGDNHMAVVADPLPDDPRLGPEFLVGGFSSNAHPDEKNAYEGLIYGPDSLGRRPDAAEDQLGPLRIYGVIEVDETTNTVIYKLKHGETGKTRFHMTLHGSGLVVGDMDGNGVLDAFDVSAFELALADPDQYALSFPGINPDIVGDIDGFDGLDAFDVDDFEALLAAAEATVPEPGVGALLMIAAAGVRLRRHHR